MWQYWNFSWRNEEAVAYLRSLLDLRGDRRPPDDSNQSLLRAWALTAAASLSSYNREGDLTRAWAEEAIDAFASADEERGLAYARLALGCALGDLGLLEEAEHVLADVIAAGHLNDQVLSGLALECRGHVASWRGDFEAANHWHQLELATLTEVGSSRQQAWAYAHLSHVARSTGDLELALEFAGRALDGLAHDAAGRAHVRTTLADVARLQGRGEEAACIYEEVSANFAAAGGRRCLASTYKNLGQLAAARGAHDEASGLFLDSMKLRRQLGDQLGVAECLHGLAAVALSTGRADDGLTLLAAAIRLRTAAGAEPLPEHRVADEALLAAAQASLTGEKFGRAWEAGTNLDTDAAVERAYLLRPVPRRI